MISMLKDKEFLKKFFKISFPVMLHALILFIVNFIDTVMVSSIEYAAGAVYAVGQTTYILMIAAFGILIGAGVFVQQFKGANDDKSLKEAFCYKIVIMLIFLAIFITVFYFFGHHLIYFYCHNEEHSVEIFALAKEYYYLILLSFIPYGLSMIYTTTVREVGGTKYALYAGAAAFISNVALNALLIYVFNWGVVGAALGTIIARVIELIIIVIISHKLKFSFCHNLFKTFHISKEMATKITKRGMVFFSNELFWVIGMTLLSLSYAQREGVNILDSLSIVGSVGNIFNILFQGLSIGIGVMVGSYLGEGNFESAKDYAKKVYWLGFLASVILGVLIIALSPVIPMMFSKVDPVQKAYASKMLIAYGLLIWGSCLYCCCYVTLKTGGEALTTFFIDSGLMWGVAVPLSWILVKFTNLELLYVYAIVVGIDILKFLVSYVFVKKEKWVKNLTVTD